MTQMKCPECGQEWDLGDRPVDKCLIKYGEFDTDYYIWDCPKCDTKGKEAG